MIHFDPADRFQLPTPDTRHLKPEHGWQNLSPSSTPRGAQCRALHSRVLRGLPGCNW